MTDIAELAQRLQALEDIDGMRTCFDESNFLIDFGFIGQFTDMDAFIEVFESLAFYPTHYDSHHGMAPEIKLADHN